MAFENKYDAKCRENEIRDFWNEKNINTFDKLTKKEVFSIDTPPPTMSGKMHIGHAFSFSQQDFIARYKKMQGFEVYYPFGTDDNGLATEKLVQKETGVDLRKVSREEAIKVVIEYLDKNRDNFIQDWKNIGMSCDFSLCYSTIDEYSRKISQKTFLDLFKKGLVERREGPIPWDRVFQTTIAQAELEDVEKKSKMNYIKAKVVGTENTYIIYATTRPEMIFACHGFSVEDKGDYVKLKVGNEFWIFGAGTYEEKLNKFEIKFEKVEDLKGKNLIGEKVIIPIINREIEITHDESIKAELGTGAAYFCSFGGVEDIEYTKRHNSKIYDILNKDGTLNHLCDEFEGLLASEDARWKVIAKLKEIESLIKSEPITHVVKVGERSGVDVEYLTSKQWFVKYLDKKEYFWEMAEKFNWFPEHMKSRIENWIKGLSWDWGFSRQRHYGIPIPVWYDIKGNIYLPDESELPVDPTSYRPKNISDDIELIPEKDVFDTWFTSASSPFLAINFMKNEEVYDKLFPLSLRPQAHDIINFWLFYTMAKTNILTNQNPFKDVAISGWVLAADGTKMSKSKGNTISPQEIIEKYSADSIRFSAASTKLGYDIAFQEKEVKSGFGVANKLYNATKFMSMLFKNFKKEDIDFNFNNLNTIDKYIIAKAQQTIKIATQGFEKYDYSKAKFEFEKFFMNSIADNYIEIVKERLWKPEEFGINETLKAQKAIYYSLFTVVKGFAPIMPYITEEVYQNFFKKYENEVSIHQTSWPNYEKKYDDENIIKLGNDFILIVGSVRKFKAENNTSQKTQLEYLKIECNKELENFINDSLRDLKSVTGATQILFENNCEIQTENKEIRVSMKLKE